MAKKPFSMRVEEHLQYQFKALSFVTNMSAEELLSEMILRQEMAMNTEEQEAYKALLKAWRVKEGEK